MKNFVLFLLAVFMIVTMFSCGNPTTTGVLIGNTSEKTEDIKKPVSNEGTSEKPLDLSNWGVEDVFSTARTSNIDRYYIRLPRYKGSTYMYSKISEQLDDTVALVSGVPYGV